MALIKHSRFSVLVVLALLSGAVWFRSVEALTSHGFFVVAQSTTTADSKPSTHNNKKTLLLELNDPSTLEDANSSGNNKDAYHLLWSPKAWSKFLYTTAALMILPRLLSHFTGSSFDWMLLQSPPSSPSHHDSSLPVAIQKVWNNLLLPLVASACCLLQLILNSLAIGRGGFNKVLGPVRPFFLAWLVVASLQPPRPSAFTLAGRGSVALLPEMFDWYNNYSHHRILRQAKRDASTLESEKGSDSDGSANPVVTEVDEITMDIPTMGCVACVHAVNDALRSVPGVVSASSQLYPMGGGGSALVQLKAQGTPTSFQDLIDAVELAGFDDVTINKDKIERKNLQQAG